MRDFLRAHPGTELDVVTLFDVGAATAALRSGTIDASFRALTMPARQLPDGIETTRVLNEPVQLLTGPAHEFAAASAVTPAGLAGHSDNPHPALSTLRSYLGSVPPGHREAGTWTPGWAHGSSPPRPASGSNGMSSNG